MAADPMTTLDWLEGVVKAILQSTTLEAPSPPPQSEVSFSPGDACLGTIRRRLDHAARTADLCVFTITDDRITRSIVDAHRRKIAVRVITDDDKATDLGSDVRRLRDEGIEVRTDHSPAHMHHKFAIFDGRWLLNGSYNWTRGAAAENLENLVATTDGGLIEAFQREFDAIWDRLEVHIIDRA